MRSRKDGSQSEEDNTPPYHYSRSIKSTDTDFLEHDYFDFMKPTDYTYSRSPSYRRKVRSQNYQMPNMKRRLLRGVYQAAEDFSTDDEEEFEEEEEAYVTDEEIISTRTVREDGMLLRSGHSLKNENTLIERINLRRSVMSGNEYEAMTSSSRSSGKEYEAMSSSSRSSGKYHEMLTSSSRRSGKDYDGMTSGSQKSNKNYERVTSSSRRSQNLDRNHINSDIRTRNRRSMMSANEYNGYMGGLTTSSRRSDRVASGSKMHGNQSTDMTTIRKTLIQEFEEDEEKGMKDSQSTKNKKKTSTVINHLYGLDSDELSESEWSLMNSNAAVRGRNSNDCFKGQSSSRSDTSITTTVVTTIIESVSYVASPVVTPIWNAVGRPVAEVLWTIISNILLFLHYVLWTSSGRHIYSLGRTIVNSLWNIIQYFIMHFILVDTWILKKRKRSGCCLCLPLLLLLPLLVLGTSSVLSILSESSIFSASSDRVIKIADSEGISLGYLQDEVRRIIVHLQDNRNVLTKGDVEAIVQHMLQQEIKQLRLGLDEVQNDHKATIMSQGNDFNQKLTLLNSQIINNITILQDQLSLEIQNVKSEGVSQSSAAVLNMEKLKNEISDLRSALGTVELSQEMLQIQMKNCCKNDSFYAMTIQTHVNRVLQQLMAGQKTGIDDQDSFTAWFHTHYVSREDLDGHLAKFGQQITKMVMLEVEKQQKTQVFLGGGGLSEQLVARIVEEALLKYSADKLALPDFALESAGGSVVSTRCSQTYHRKTAQYSILGIPLWYVSNSPRTVIQPEIYPGSCWAFQGSRGYIIIELSTIIKPTAFTLEHVPKSLTPDGKITSAPKDFLVLGLSSESDTQGKLLGNYTYREDGKPLQFFPVQITDGIFKFVELQILNNHGNQMFTCLYRFRVHGIPSKQDRL